MTPCGWVIAWTFYLTVLLIYAKEIVPTQARFIFLTPLLRGMLQLIFFEHLKFLTTTIMTSAILSSQLSVGTGWPPSLSCTSLMRTVSVSWLKQWIWTSNSLRLLSTLFLVLLFVPLLEIWNSHVLPKPHAMVYNITRPLCLSSPSPPLSLSSPSPLWHITSLESHSPPASDTSMGPSNPPAAVELTSVGKSPLWNRGGGMRPHNWTQLPLTWQLMNGTSRPC